MKATILLLLSLLLLTSSIFAQTTIIEDAASTSREQWRGNLFRIDLSQMPTGFLLEYSLNPFDANKYDGVSTANEPITDYTRIFQLHKLLSLSRVNGNASLQNTDDLFDQAVTNKINGGGAIPFIVLCKQYNRMRSSAISEGLFKFDTDNIGLLDVPGRAASPYDTYNLFALTPFISDIHQFDPISFSFPAGLWETNGISTMNVDFGDGAGYRSIGMGSTVSVSYGSAGIKTVTAQINSAGQTLTASCQVNIVYPDEYFNPKYFWNINIPALYHNDNEYLGAGAKTIKPFGGISPLYGDPGARVSVETGCDDVFDKPIIVVEGFDPDDNIDATELGRLFAGNGFKETAKAYGYDFVYVDFTNNTTYIENNAKVLQAVIQQVNQVKTGSNPISIIGWSMGGLIARWCLKDMEDNGITHNVQNFFSYDAPQQGANIPLGLQYLFHEISNDLPWLKWFSKDFRQIEHAFQSPAAKQMLVTYGGNAPSSINPLFLHLIL